MPNTTKIASKPSLSNTPGSLGAQKRRGGQTVEGPEERPGFLASWPDLDGLRPGTGFVPVTNLPDSDEEDEEDQL